MKKILFLLLFQLASAIHAQNLTVQNLTVTGTTNLALPPAVPGDCKNILSYGGAGNNSTDNTTPLNNLLAAASNGPVCAYFPPGKYKFSANVAYTLANANASITIKGDGADLTELTWSGTDGITVNYVSPFNSVHVRDMTFTTSGVNGGTALKLNQTYASYGNTANSAPSDIIGVTFRGADGYAAAQYWAYGIDVFNVSNINFINDSFTGGAGGYATAGVGVNLHGTSAVPPVVFNFTDTLFQWLQTGIIYGAYVQGVTVAQSNFTGDGYGIHVPANDQIIDQLAVTSSEFNCGLQGIYVESSLSNTIIHNDYFIVPTNAVGLGMPTIYSYSIVGNTFEPLMGATNTTGVAINNTIGSGGVISANVFSYLNTGVYLQSASSKANLQSNQYANNTNDYVNSAGNKNKVGVATP